ncbi:carboxy-terminal domain RNA polymerase II polypeptide A small phosphatase 2-like protein [Carex littledalei]|uniref:Mitochondrial import inner membrane translocase subunit TIM50 n=1 Tax=Carex littledalei TaxID=544730 RepID=A0A833VHZ8_9POAL|nr:carboxy-terminal domain RNA polymerase II polypeptide A small phosphatase 2-like protein [Carex littledalei]
MRSPIRSLPSSPCKSSPPPLPDSQKKTLCISVFRTIIHTSLNPPPGAYDFSLDLVKNEKTSTLYVILRPGYQIVIITASVRDYASPIIDRLDPNGLIAHRLYRDSCKRNKQGMPIKDLALTGRSLDRCIIIDDIWRRVPQWDNVVRIRPFKGDMKDAELMRLLQFFYVERRYEDLRDAVSHVNEWFGYQHL